MRDRTSEAAQRRITQKRPAGLGALLTCALAVGIGVSAAPAAAALNSDEPHLVIEETVQTLLDEFTRKRESFAADKGELFALVDQVAVPLFDFGRIAKLVLARHWKQADARQRDEFGEAFKKLLIGTYATALFQYTGNEKMIFTGSEISERKGRKFAIVHSEVSLSGGAPIKVDYAMLLGKDGAWKIYNLTIGGINMITNYRNTYAAAIDDLGLDGVVASMKAAYSKQLSKPGQS